MNRLEPSSLYATRIGQVQQSFIREILEVANQPGVISLAGGLPNPNLFPVAELQLSAERVFRTYGKRALQYASTEGHDTLRQYIADRYRAVQGLNISYDEILITNGSQQALDLICKLFINPGDNIIVERPSYLGALQCFSMYEANVLEVDLTTDGIDVGALSHQLTGNSVKLIYGIPNYQNPTGISYNQENRDQLAQVLRQQASLFVEDDPYGEICFTRNVSRPLYSYLPEQSILLGSFSKTVAPGLRLGWMVASKELIKRATILKQASDLHSGNLAQYILIDYLQNNNLDEHISKIVKSYKHHCDVMLDSLDRYFPAGIKFNEPRGGMFCWLRLPEGRSARELLTRAIQAKILFVPGDVFYHTNPELNTLRLNFSNVEESAMREALKKLGSLIP